MKTFHTSLSWSRRTPDFNYESYDRNHRIRFGSGSEVVFSSAPEFIGDATRVNPEEAFLASLSSCHMLTFLAIAAKSRYTLDEYGDEAEAELGKNPEGELAILRVTLRPKVVFGGDSPPNAQKIKMIHERAHRHCFIANSVRCTIDVSPR